MRLSNIQVGRNGSVVLFAALLVALCPSDAFAVWGQNWGSMVWGAAAPSDATLPTWGLGLLAILLLGVGMRFLKRGTLKGGATGAAMFLAVFSLTAIAAFNVTHTFSNGTTADAGQVNANFADIATELTAKGGSLTVPNTFVNGTIGAAPTVASGEPVTTVSWRDAIVWCNARSEQAGRTPAYTYSSATIKDSTDAMACDNAVLNPSATGYRLPTEAQWEYAARYQNGTSWTPGDYLSGATANYLDAVASQAVAWYIENSGGATHVVGGKTANQLAIHDMSGNVWEWCWDWHAAYGAGPVTNPIGPGTGSLRVVRGGSWNFFAGSGRVGLRDNADAPGYAHIYLGFRAVLPPGQ